MKRGQLPKSIWWDLEEKKECEGAMLSGKE